MPKNSSVGIAPMSPGTTGCECWYDNPRSTYWLSSISSALNLWTFRVRYIRRHLRPDIAASLRSAAPRCVWQPMKKMFLHGLSNTYDENGPNFPRPVVDGSSRWPGAINIFTATFKSLARYFVERWHLCMCHFTVSIHWEKRFDSNILFFH